MPWPLGLGAALPCPSLVCHPETFPLLPFPACELGTCVTVISHACVLWCVPVPADTYRMHALYRLCPCHACIILFSMPAMPVPFILHALLPKTLPAYLATSVVGGFLLPVSIPSSHALFPTLVSMYTIPFFWAACPFNLFFFLEHVCLYCFLIMEWVFVCAVGSLYCLWVCCMC